MLRWIESWLLSPRPGGPSYWLTRFVLLRWLGLVYVAAFLSLALQVLPLIGSHGLQPAATFLERAALYYKSPLSGFLHFPSLFWLHLSDAALLGLAWLGVALSVVVMLGYANGFMLTILWMLYMSFVHIGQEWYSYGWEIQLLETGFLAIFLCPFLDGHPFPKRPPPALVIWLFRWLGFRIMMGAGLIKLRSDPCWRDLSCLDHHFETQPIPNPLSWLLHFMPRWFHQLGVLWNHFIELVVPWFSFGPKHARHIAGILLVSFQVILILSGNLSFLNWLTIVPFLACFDDSFWRRVLPRALTDRADRAAENARFSRTQTILVPALGVLICILSIAPVLNLISSNQRMNTSFEPLDLVNTYGAFGSVGSVRNEIIFEGTDDDAITDHTTWKAYEFPAKPGDPNRRPAIIAPFQPRLDWSIWFAAMSSPRQYPWTLHFTWKLLHNDAGALSLLANNPFPDAPPKWIRAVRYHYEFAPPGDASGAWWKRTEQDLWLPPLSVNEPTFRRILAEYGWVSQNER